MIDPTRFGTATHPLRMSGLPSLVLCAMREFLAWQGMLDDESGTAAETGSAAHRVIDFLHSHKWDIRLATESVSKRISDLPNCDWEVAKKHATAYAQDPRNRDARIVGSERRVELVLEPHELDTTRQPIIINGTIDQIRLDADGRSRVYDVKTGRLSGLAMLDCYQAQLAGYSKAAEADLPPAVIRTAGYLEKGVTASECPPGIYYYSTLTPTRIEWIMAAVRLEVAMIRLGHINHRPGFHCSTICPARSTQQCLYLFERVCNAATSEA